MQQSRNLHDEFAMRALLTTDHDGRFSFRSISPRCYPIPTYGPAARSCAPPTDPSCSPSACTFGSTPTATNR